MGAHKVTNLSEGGQLSLFSVEEIEDEAVKLVPEQAFRVIGDEVLSEKLDPECWAKALVGGGRTKAAALSMYAKLRSEELSEGTDWKLAKARALEHRKITAAQAIARSNPRAMWGRRFSLLWDFLFWQALLSVSGVGLYLGVLAMSGRSHWWPGWIMVLAVSACLQISPLIFYGLGRMLFGKLRYHYALGLTAGLTILLGALFSVQSLRGKRLPNISLSELASKFEKKIGPSEQTPAPGISVDTEF